MEKDMLSIISNRKTKSLVEKTAAIIFRGCAVMSIIAVVSITGYMIISGTPAIFKVGILDILFGTVWAPTAADPQFGILLIILTSIIGVFFSYLYWGTNRIVYSYQFSWIGKSESA